MVIQLTIGGLLKLIGFSILAIAFYQDNLKAGLLAVSALMLLKLITRKRQPAK